MIGAHTSNSSALRGALRWSAERGSGSWPLTAEQVAQYWREGFLALDAPQIPELEVAWCRNVLMRLFDRQAGLGEGRRCDLSAGTGADDGTTPQLFRPSLYAAQLRDWPFRRTGLAIARQLLGPQAALAADNAVYKPALTGGITPWHQDEAHNDPSSYQQQVTVWMAMYDTTAESGAMAFVPGSYRKGVLPHRPNRGSPQANAIECYDGFDAKTARVCPLRAGGMTIHHGLTVHGASRNTSAGPRLGYILNYKNPPVARPELGAFPWNDQVGKVIQRRRKAWLRRGGIFVEMLRFCGADADNRRHFVNQVLQRLRR